MSKENEARLSADGLSRNLGGEYAQEHGYGDADTYSDGSEKHLPAEPLHAHGHDEPRDTTGRGPDTESAEPNEDRTEHLEEAAFGERGSGKTDPGAFTQAPG
ncbi:hypothetical protein GCM10011512_05080 [Tersicoccus solisilvae]|uniref:Uncharacterized protein n=1 Tax=Tersicoccus solisilvae TaxID=1882339 RepID=A0ABQ1NQN8_9MICC|nr:hypothetical protein [Tersicoccus solisilvae]GGC81379.1 hypothetical protein GCM10011512_05080 [Tersicoccus solisilvae]